jgi:hypothetical protein
MQLYLMVQKLLPREKYWSKSAADEVVCNALVPFDLPALIHAANQISPASTKTPRLRHCNRFAPKLA